MDSPEFDLPRYLSLLPLFQEMQPPELQRLAEGSRVRPYGRGDFVARTGQPCSEFHIVVSGRVKLFAISPQGQEKIIEIVGPGSSFAEALMFLQRPYIVNAQTLMDTTLLSVSREAVVREMERDQRFCMRMLGGLSRRLHGLVTDVQAYALHSGAERVIGYLLRELSGPEDSAGAPGAGARIVLPDGKAVIASRLSMTPEYFSRVLRELAEQGLIVVDGRQITIPDSARLARWPLGAAP